MSKLISKSKVRTRIHFKPIPNERYAQMLDHTFKELYDVSPEDQQKSDDEFEEKLDEIDDEKERQKLINKREKEISRKQSKIRKKAIKQLEKQNKKKIKFRQNYQWISVTFQNEAQFYKFLDKFDYFGIVQEKHPLIIRHYDLLKNGESYRSIKRYHLDEYVKPEKEEKTNDYQNNYDDTCKISKKGKILNEKEQIKGSKIIGIRCKYIWLQLIFYYEWEFEQLKKRKGVYGFKNENNAEIVKNWNNLNEIDYRLFSLSSIDKFNAPLYDPSLSKAQLNKRINVDNSIRNDKVVTKGGGLRKKKRLSGSKKKGGGWFGFSSISNS